MDAELRTEEILAGRNHRDAERHEQHRRHEMRAPAVVRRGAVAFKAGILGDGVNPRPIIVGFGVVDRLRRPLGKIPG